MPYNDFTEMRVWQRADEIIGDVYRLTETLPKREDYALCSQLRDAAISIAGNIAEALEGAIKKIRSISISFQEEVVLRSGVIYTVAKQSDIFQTNKLIRSI